MKISVLFVHIALLISSCKFPFFDRDPHHNDCHHTYFYEGAIKSISDSIGIPNLKIKVPNASELAFKSFPNFDEYDSGYTDVQGEFWIESEFFGGCEEVSVIYAGDSIVINIDDKDTIIPFHEGMVNEIDLNENYITIPVFYQ